MLLVWSFLSGYGLSSAGRHPSGLGDPQHRRCSHLCQRSYVTSLPWGAGAELHSSCVGLRCLRWALWRLLFPQSCRIHPPQSADPITGRLSRLPLPFLRFGRREKNFALSWLFLDWLCFIGFFFFTRRNCKVFEQYFGKIEGYNVISVENSIVFFVENAAVIIL